MRSLPPALAAALLALSAVTARADLSFANPAVDVGEVRSGAPLTQPVRRAGKIVYENRRGAPLILARVARRRPPRGGDPCA